MMSQATSDGRKDDNNVNSVHYPWPRGKGLIFALCQ